MNNRLDAERLQQVRRTDTGKHQELRRLEGAGANDDLARSLHRSHPVAVTHDDAGRPVAGKLDLQHIGFCRDIEVLAPAHRVEKSEGSAETLPRIAGRGLIADTAVTNRIDIVRIRDALNAHLFPS